MKKKSISIIILLFMCLSVFPESLLVENEKIINLLHSEFKYMNVKIEKCYYVDTWIDALMKTDTVPEQWKFVVEQKTLMPNGYMLFYVLFDNGHGVDDWFLCDYRNGRCTIYACFGRFSTD